MNTIKLLFASLTLLAIPGARSRKPPIPVGLGAPGARVQFTRFIGRCTTGGATRKSGTCEGRLLPP
jgi:hypothetical protein